MGNELQVLAAERMAMTGAEVGEGHAPGAPDHRFHGMDLSRETEGRQPALERTGFDECPIDTLRRSAQNAMKTDGVGGHDCCS